MAFEMGPRPVRACCTRTGPRHPWLGTAAFRFILPLLERVYARHRIYRLNSAFAADRLRAVRAELERGGTVYLAGIAAGKATKSNKLGFVAAFPIPQTLLNIDAFELGAQSVNPGVQTYAVFTGAWCDPASLTPGLIVLRGFLSCGPFR